MKKLIALVLLALVPLQFGVGEAADNITINAGTAGYATTTVLKSKDRSGAHSQVVVIEGATADRLLVVNADGSINVGGTVGVSGTVTVSGTVAVSNPGTVADNTAFSAGSGTTSVIAGCRQDTPGAITDGRSACPRVDSNRVWFSHPVASNGSSVTDATNLALRATLVTIPQIGGQVAAGSVKGFPNCDKSAFLKMTSATTTEIVPLTAGEIVHVCYFNIVGGGATTTKFVSGTGANCGSNTVDLTPAYDLAAQTVLSAGSGIGEVLSTQPTGALDAQNGRALCATNSAAQNASIFVKYAKF